MPNRESVPVVTCFIMRAHRGEDQILLVRRSDRVRTYQGAWAAISGYLEPGVTPVEQAQTEILEETGLTPDDVALEASGETLIVDDGAHNLMWAVHPFLFRLQSTSEPSIDWEAHEYAWVSPSGMSGRETVPGLVEALALVYPR